MTFTPFSGLRPNSWTGKRKWKFPIALRSTKAFQPVDGGMWSKQRALLQWQSQTWGSRLQSLKGAPRGAGNSTRHLCSEQSWGIWEGEEEWRKGIALRLGGGQHHRAVQHPPGFRDRDCIPPPALYTSFIGTCSPQPRGQHLPCLNFLHCSTPRLGLWMQHSTGAASPAHP